MAGLLADAAGLVLTGTEASVCGYCLLGARMASADREARVKLAAALLISIAMSGQPSQDRGGVRERFGSGGSSLMRPNDVARLLAVSRAWVYEAARTGRIPSIRIGGADGPLRFVPDDIEGWLDEQRAEWTPGTRAGRRRPFELEPSAASATRRRTTPVHQRATPLGQQAPPEQQSLL